jgi:2-polyprenyl-3-methyl-5-hydroxy-6-metoxy-1,4-benzoquinol methylase
MTAPYATCDLCGATDAVHLLDSPRLDGPLVRCRRCGLVYVGRRNADFTFAAADDARSSALADRVAELGLVRHEIEDAERPLRIEADRERLARLTRHVAGGSLLDVGSATGTFLGVASQRFAAQGVEPDPITSEQSRAAGHRVTTGTLADVDPPDRGFDAITMLHVLEHLDSPTTALEQVHRLLKPGGVVLIETPTVECLWFRLAPARWRQLIPDHYYFFGQATLTELLRRTGFEPVEHGKVGRRVSLRFVADRARRSGLPLAKALPPLLAALHLDEATVRVNPGDIMSVTARRSDSATRPRRP